MAATNTTSPHFLPVAVNWIDSEDPFSEDMRILVGGTVKDDGQVYDLITLCDWEGVPVLELEISRPMSREVRRRLESYDNTHGYSNCGAGEEVTAPDNCGAANLPLAI